MKKYDDAMRQKIADMYAHGKLHREIHEETGVAMSTISVICREFGIDKCHRGGKTAQTIPVAPEIPAAKTASSPIMITSRTLTLHGTGTGCNYVAGTDMQNIDITLGDWALSIETSRLDNFINELQHIKKMVGIA